MHWTAGSRFSLIFHITGPPPVMCNVRRVHNMIDFSEHVGLLREAVAEPAKLPILVPQFQDIVWHSSVSFPSQVAEDAARDLAYDLEYYVTDQKPRAQDSS